MNGLPCVFATVSSTVERSIRTKRPKLVPKQVAQLDQTGNVLGTVDVIDVWEASVLPSFRNKAVGFEGRQWSGLKSGLFKLPSSSSGGGQMGG